MEKVCKIWDDELTSILDIEKIGHRKRILLSVAGKHDIANRFGKVYLQANCIEILPFFKWGVIWNSQ